MAILVAGAVLTAIPLVICSGIGKPLNRAQTVCIYAVACVLAAMAILSRA